MWSVKQDQSGVVRRMEKARGRERRGAFAGQNQKDLVMTNYS